MPTSIVCRCGQTYLIQDHLIGKQLSCPTCQSPLFVPPPVQRAAGHSPKPMPEGASATSTASLWVLGGASAATGLLLLLLMVAVLFSVSRPAVETRPAVIQSAQSVAAGEPAGRDDYAQQRVRHQTRLLQRGPAPQQWQPLQTPSGAERRLYSSGGRQLAAYVTPATLVPQPAVLFLHGGFAFGEGDWEMTRPFRDAGFAVMMPVLRGENGQPGEFTLFFDEVSDVLAAAAELASLPHVDAQRIFVTGHSAGGTLAALAAMSGKFRAASSLSGCMDQRLNRDLAPFDIRNDDEFAIRSPLDYAGSFACPCRLYCGSQESTLLQPARETAERARRAGREVEFEIVAGDHFSSVDEGIRHTIAFFQQVDRQTRPAAGGDARTAASDAARAAAGTPPATTLPTESTAPGATPPATTAASKPAGSTAGQPPATPRARVPAGVSPDANRRPANASRSRFGFPPARPAREIPLPGPVVAIKVNGYSGDKPPQLAVMEVARGISWIRHASVSPISHEVVFHVRGTSISTAVLRPRLINAGFDVGRTQYLPQGRRPN